MNDDIKLKMFQAKLKQFELARLMGIHEGNLSKMLNRKEMTVEEKEKIIKIIERGKKMLENKMILNLKELSNYLKISKSMIRKLIYENDIPFYKVGNRYYFEKEIIQQWIISKHNNIEIGGIYDENQ